MPSSKIPLETRKKLWAEHLGYQSNDPALQNRPSKGWLNLWNYRASAKLTDLKKNQPQGHPANILKWNHQKYPKKYLKDLGLVKTNFKVLQVKKEIRGFDFATGKWK